MGIDFGYVSGAAHIAAGLFRRWGRPGAWTWFEVRPDGLDWVEISVAGTSCFEPAWRLEYAATRARVVATAARAHGHLEAMRAFEDSLWIRRP